MRKVYIILLLFTPFFLLKGQIEGCSDPEAINYYCNTEECPWIDENGDGFPDLDENFMPMFGLPDGFIDDCSCYYNPGCMNDDYLEYDPEHDYPVTADCETLIVEGCTNANACNYNLEATLGNTLSDNCTFSELYYNCAGDCINDADGDTVCDENEVAGCTDSNALNFYADACCDCSILQ